MVYLKTLKFLCLLFLIGFIGCQANSDDLKFKTNFLKGIKASKELNKPIFLNFTGYECMAHNEFMDDLASSKEIQNKLNEEFITVQLYVDDKRKIQENDTLGMHTIEFSKKGIERLKNAKTIGNINAAIEIDIFQNNSQPLYVIMDSERNILVKPFGYTSRDRASFLAKLKEGLTNFEN